MSFDALVLPLIGLAGIFIGVVAMIVIAHRRANQKYHRSSENEEAGACPEDAETILVLGEAVDMRELRILRELLAEPKGRLLKSFKGPYYRSPLEATIDKGRAKPAGRRYFLTPKGEDFCCTYVEQLLREYEAKTEV